MSHSYRVEGDEPHDNKDLNRLWMIPNSVVLLSNKAVEIDPYPFDLVTLLYSLVIKQISG